MKNRILFGLLAAILVVTALITFYNFTSSPTDENIFTDSPGKLMFARPLEIPSDNVSIDEGDILVAFNGIKGKDKTPEEMRQAILRIPQDSVVRLEVNQSRKMKYGKFKVPAGSLRDMVFLPVDSTVIVTIVAPGGASDRAGMLPGDVIEKINGQRFSNAQEADRILRRARSGGSFTYDILRGSNRLTLNVVLAAFGIPLATLILSLAGFVYLGIGAFIALKRPQLRAARLLGLSFMLIGFVIAVWVIRRDPDPTPFVVARAVGIGLALFFGIAVSWHSGTYFPMERPEMLSRRWISRVNYGLAGLLSLAAVVLGSQGWLDKERGVISISILVSIPIIYNTIIKLRFRKLRAPEYIAQRDLIKRTDRKSVV